MGFLSENTIFYIERNLIEFLKEFIEQKILFDPQDILLTEEIHKKFGWLRTKYGNFNEEVIDKFYDDYISHGLTALLYFDMPLQDHIIKVIEESIEASNNFYRQMQKEIFDKKILKEKMSINYVERHDVDRFLMKIFKYNMIFELSFNVITHSLTKKKVLRVRAFFCRR